jgi:hypothetical protein
MPKLNHGIKYPKYLGHFFNQLSKVNNHMYIGPGGVAQSTSHSPQEQKTGVQISPGCKVF